MKKKKKAKKRPVAKKKKKTVKKPAKKIKKKKAAGKPGKKAVKAAVKKAARTSVPAGAALEEIGVVTHYFPHVDAAVVKMTKGSLAVGDTIIIKGHTTDFKEKVNSIQLDHVPINSASPGQEIGLLVKSKVREHDVVYKLIS